MAQPGLKGNSRDGWQAGAHVWAQTGILDTIFHGVPKHMYITEFTRYRELQCSARDRTETRF